MLKRIREKLGREAARVLFKKPAIFPANKKIVSFTFDDFPHSAQENGARLLESFGSRGTFYISFGLEGGNSPVGKIVERQDIFDLHQKGHEIGGHTFSHLDCTSLSPKSIQNDCQKNQRLASQIGDISLQSFSYPFGGINPNCKKTIGKIFQNARSIVPFINRGNIDLAALGSIRLYRNTRIESVLSQVNELENSGGWLVFHTHDVRKEPSQFGCTTDFLECVIRECSNRGFQMLPMTEAMKMASL